MAQTLKSIMNRLSHARRAKIEGRSKELIKGNHLAENTKGEAQQKQVPTEVKETNS